MSWVSNLVLQECHTNMLVKEIDISRLMIYTKWIESEKLKQRQMGKSKRACFEGGFSSSKTGSSFLHQGQGLSQVSNQRFVNDRVSYPKIQCEDGPTNPKCARCGKNHVGSCLKDLGACYGCGNIGYKLTECLNITK